MQRFDRFVLSQFNDPRTVPAGEVRDGEIFEVQTELASGDWLHSVDDSWDPSKTSANNPCVTLSVAGALPGDVLAVTIRDIVTQGFGYMAIGAEDAVFPEVTRRIFGEVFSNTVVIDDGYIQVSERIRVPVAPLIGTLGTTQDGEPSSHVRGGRYGGNMDVQEVGVGATLRLPVFVAGALLNIGDVHARQSDAELSAVETRATVRLEVAIERPPAPLPWPTVETDDFIGAIALDDDLKRASAEAFSALHGVLVDRFGLDPAEAYLLLGAAGEARCTRLLEPGNHPYIWKVAKRLLPR